MKYTQHIGLGILFCIWIGFGIHFLLTQPKPSNTIRIDCTLSEISPDFTPELKQLCRNAKQIK